MTSEEKLDQMMQLQLLTSNAEQQQRTEARLERTEAALERLLQEREDYLEDSGAKARSTLSTWRALHYPMILRPPSYLL